MISEIREQIFVMTHFSVGETLSSHRKIVLLKAKIGNHILFFENVM